MTSFKTQPVDFIAELRLRQWARNNYIPAMVRQDSDWHPIVLDEMRRKDADLEAQELMMSQQSGMVVPLMPEMPDNTRLDAAHQAIPAPQFLSNPAAAQMPIPYYV